MAHPVVHFEISAPDGQAAADFYGKMFDWNIHHDPALDYYMVNTGEGQMGGGIMKSPCGTPSVSFYVHVDDLNAYLAKAESLGGRTVMPPMEIAGGHGSCAMFADPSGNMIGLWTSPEAPAA